MLKIGVIGLGNIAQKAYLPTMAGLQDEYEWHLTTRNREKGEQLTARYGFTHLHQTLEELLAVHPDAVFVHTPTATHPGIIRTLLNAGTHVYVDKPVATDMAVVRELYALAAKRGLLLTAGFNRRFAPHNVMLKAVSDKQMIVAEKTRAHTQQPAEFAIWDLMIHSIDTALWLVDEPVIAQTTHVLVDAAGNLRQGYLDVASANSTARVITNMDAHANQEIVTVQGRAARGESRDLLQLATANTAGLTIAHRPDWEPMLETRGFAQLTKAFLTAVQTGGANPVAPDSAIASHAACAAVVEAIGKE